MAKIFYIEDYDSMKDLMLMLLAKRGHAVIHRYDTDKAEAIISIWKPDLVITDNRLGEGKELGIDLARRLHADGIKVAVLSSCPVAEGIAKEEGIPFFLKGIQIDKLLKEMKIGGTDNDNINS